eukprot:4479899-Amphidinium_carterae.1
MIHHVHHHHHHHHHQDGSTACVLCEFGHFNDDTSRSACRACNFGSFGAAVGLTACTLCAQGTFQDTMGQPACVSCGSVLDKSTTNQLGVTSKHDCMCPVGYMDPRAYGSNSASCLSCPKGLSCPGPSNAVCPFGSDVPTCTCAEVGILDSTRIRDCVDPSTGSRIGCPANILCNNATVGIDFDEQATVACPQTSMSAEQFLSSCSLSRRCMWALGLCEDEAGIVAPVFEPQDILRQGYYSQIVPAAVNVTDNALARPARFDLDGDGIWLCATTDVCPGQMPATSDPCNPQHRDVKCASCTDDYVRYGSYRDRCKECNIGKIIIFPLVFIMCVILVVASQMISPATMNRRNLIVA